MNRIDLRGVIVPSEYAVGEWAQKYVKAGIITPEVTFRSALAAAPKNQPVEVYVNSPGGSVFAANEMINAARDWKAETKQPVVVTIGAMAASAASAFAIMAADKIRVHKNAKMMFHGAWTVSVGGKELHQDTAELLEKINADIKARLVSKYGMSPELVSEWFAEGREGWLSAEDMMESKIADEEICDPSDAIEFPAEAVKEIEQGGIGIAALLIKNNTNEEKNNAEDQAGEAGGTGAGDAEGAAGAEAGTKESGPALQPVDVRKDPADQDQVIKAITEQIKADKEAEIKGLNERIATLEAKEKRLTESCREWQGKHDSLKAISDKAISDLATKHSDEIKNLEIKLAKSVSEANAARDDAVNRLARFLSGAMTFSPGPANWAEALKAHGGDYVAAAKAHPELRDKFNAENRSK